MITKKDMKQFLELYLTINNVQDRAELLSNIVDTALDIVHCDAGTLYLLENNSLQFCQMHTRSLNIRQSGFDSPIDLPPVPMEENYVCAWAALHNQIINVADVNTDKRFDFSGAARYDKLTGYHTVSMLVVPMADEKGRLIGVMQLINALSGKGEIVPFDKEDELIISAVALQAATSLTNIHYAVQISQLLDSLVKSLSTAVDERSAYTGSHTRHMVQIAEHFLDWLEKTNNDWNFDNDKRNAFLMSVWLHDIGKLAIPLEVMDKATRLGSLLPELEERLRVIGLLDRIAMLEGKITEDELSIRNRHREEVLGFILQINGGKPLSDESIARIEDISRLTYRDEKKKKHSLELRLIVMILVPVAGPLFFIFSYLVYKLFFSEPVDLEDVVFSKDKVKFNVRAEEEKERNLISLEEAVEITDKKELRTLMMSVVSGDTQKFLSSINFALTSNDSETAHYAASVLQDALNDFRINVEKQ